MNCMYMNIGMFLFPKSLYKTLNKLLLSTNYARMSYYNITLRLDYYLKQNNVKYLILYIYKV